MIESSNLKWTLSLCLSRIILSIVKTITVVLYKRNDNQKFYIKKTANTRQSHWFSVIFGIFFTEKIKFKIKERNKNASVYKLNGSEEKKKKKKETNAKERNQIHRYNADQRRESSPKWACAYLGSTRIVTRRQKE